jgi:hypothetical protein
VSLHGCLEPLSRRRIDPRELEERALLGSKGRDPGDRPAVRQVRPVVLQFLEALQQLLG